MRKASQEMTVCDFQYTARWGGQEIRNCLVETFSNIANLNNLNADENVIVNLGAIILIRAIVEIFVENDDDEVVFFEPIYPYHLCGMQKRGTIVPSRLKWNASSRRFEFDYETLKAKLNAKTKLLILCNPSNPTSRLWTKDEYKKLTEILSEFPNIKVIEDCAYCIYQNNNAEITYFHEIGNNFDRTYTVFSAGKIFNTTGNRLGFAFAGKYLIDEYKRRVNQSYFPSAMEQKVYVIAFREALKEYKGHSTFWAYQAWDNNQRLNYLVEGLNKLGITSYESQGTYYLTMDVSNLVEKVEDKYYFKLGSDALKKDPYRDKAVCRKLIIDHGVGLAPFSGLYLVDKKYDQFIRIPFNRSYEDLDFLLSSIKKLLSEKK